jgi:hypothetical protein
MKDLIEIDRGIDFCHEMQTMLSRHCVEDGICAPPIFITNCETREKVMTPLLAQMNFPQIHHVGCILLHKKMWRGTRTMWSWLYEKTFSLHTTLLEGRYLNRVQ